MWCARVRLTLSRILSDCRRCHVLGDICVVSWAEIWFNFRKARGRRFNFLNCSQSVIHWRARVKKDSRFSYTKLTGNHEVVDSACLPRFLFDYIVFSCRVVQHGKDLFHRSSGREVGLCSKRLQQSERREARGRQVGIR